eukprot:6306928-Karenia_brevis.AAC.1
MCIRDRVYIDPVVENEVEKLMMEATGENTADAYEVAYDTLSHDLRRDEKFRERGVKTQGWP